MASTNKIDSLKRAAESGLIKLQGKRYLAGDLNERLRKTADEYRQDVVIQVMAQVIDKIARQEPERLISQYDIEELYHEVAGLNASGTRCREALGDLFITASPESQTHKNHNFINGLRDNPEEGIVNFASEEMVEEYSDLFSSKEDKYDPRVISGAKDKVSLELYSLGLDKARVKFAGGNSEVLFFTAELDTPRGTVNVVIPSDASGKEFPKAFFADNQLVSLTKKNLKNYLNNMIKKADGISIADESINIPSVQMPESLKTVAADFEDKIMDVSVGYPEKSVKIAKQMVAVELSSMGFKGTQVRVLEPMKDGFVCQAILNTPNGKVSIDVPIEMNGIAPLLPSVFACEDQIADFNAASIKALTMKKVATRGCVNRDCQLYSMDVGQLRDIIVRAAVSGDLNTCDEALEVIAETTNPETYMNAVVDYQKILAGVKSSKESIKQAYDDSDQFVKTSTSMYPIHKKFGRPAHELVRDEDGEYHLKSTYYARKNQETAGAFFSNAKILVGD